MNTYRHGKCEKCKRQFYYSIGRPRIPLLRQSEQPKETILDWFESIKMTCYGCNPIPDRFTNQAGVVLHKEL